MKILGIDPGIHGALAYYDGTELLIWDMPIFKKESGGNDLDIHRLKEIIFSAGAEHCILEKTTPLPGIGGKSAYSMGKSEGAIIGILASLNIPYTLVRPAQWKKAMDCPADKGLARQRASQLLPKFAHNWDRKKDDGRAESALLALFGYRGK